MQQQLKWNEEKNEATLITKNDDGTLSVEPITIEQATQWTAENKF